MLNGTSPDAATIPVADDEPKTRAMKTAVTVMVTTGVRCPVTTLDAASVFDSIHGSLEDLLARHDLFGFQLQILRKRRLHESHIHWRGSSRSGLELCMVLRRKVESVAR